MPSRNALKTDIPDAYYHVYARGVNKMQIFLDQTDFLHFQSLLKRYLSPPATESQHGVLYPSYFGNVELLAFCQMENHFHLLIYQTEQKNMASFMQSLLTSYSKYFNKKYGRSGPLFESRYKASPITNNTYLQHMSRYIHLNPRSWKKYEHSSIRYYLYGEESAWLLPDRIKALFAGTKDYFNFLEDYEEQREILKNIKHELIDR